MSPNNPLKTKVPYNVQSGSFYLQILMKIQNNVTSLRQTKTSKHFAN